MFRIPVCRRLILLVPVLVPLALGACSGGSADWVKSGASEERIRADNAACRAESEQAYRCWLGNGDTGVLINRKLPGSPFEGIDNNFRNC